MKNRNTKIKFTDIAGMLERDQMREIIGGCGTSGSGAYTGDTSSYLNQYAGADSTFSSFISSAGFIGMMGQGGTGGVFGANSTGTSVSSSLNSYVYNSAFMADLNKPKSIQVTGITITYPVEIAKFIAGQVNGGGYYTSTVTYDANGMGHLGEITILTLKAQTANNSIDAFNFGWSVKTTLTNLAVYNGTSAATVLNEHYLSQIEMIGKAGLAASIGLQAVDVWKNAGVVNNYNVASVGTDLAIYAIAAELPVAGWTLGAAYFMANYYTETHYGKPLYQYLSQP